MDGEQDTVAVYFRSSYLVSLPKGRYQDKIMHTEASNESRTEAAFKVITTSKTQTYYFQEITFYIELSKSLFKTRSEQYDTVKYLKVG